MGSERRVNAQANDIPTDLVKAIVSIEDHRFFDHRGLIPSVSWELSCAICKAILQGGSTLTQQLIKLTYFSTSTSDQTISRKAQEAWLAIQLEQKATKQEILTYYINKVYMSNGNYGMQTAAQNYYGKDLNNLSLPQLALLAGMPQAPNQYDPYSHPEAAQDRRNLVLSEMKIKATSLLNSMRKQSIHQLLMDYKVSNQQVITLLTWIITSRKSSIKLKKKQAITCSQLGWMSTQM